jgi:hypothetical protein
MCGFLQVPLYVLNVHGGISSGDVIEWMNEPITKALTSQNKDIYVFFDEINTCNCLSLFKNIICDGFLQGLFS